MTPLEELLSYAGRGWRLLPCHAIQNGACTCGKPGCDSPGKHPRTYNGVKGATADVEQIRSWHAMFPENAVNWALATGVGSGVDAIDVDAKNGGYASWSAYLEESGIVLPRTMVTFTGGGGRHFLFDPLGERHGNRVNWRPGVDFRGDGGYVMLPGSTHISGEVYRVEYAHDVAALPTRLATDLGRSVAPSVLDGLSFADFLGGVNEGARDETIFKMTCKLRRVLGDEPEVRAFIEAFILEGAAQCSPTFPEDQARRKIEQAYKQDHRDIFDVDRMPFAAPEGELYDFLADLDAETVVAVEKAVKAAKVRVLAARVLREERIAKYGDAAALDGESFMFGEVAVDVPIWGEGDDLLWTEQGGLLIPADQGLGKSFTAQQIEAARLGVGPMNLLGLPIAPLDPGKIVVYLALDRPRQIARSMARLFRTDRERAIARERLRIWTKPVPVDVLGDTFAFADWVQETFGDNVGDLVVDSMKDLTPANLSNGEVGQALDMAWKECRARGMSTLILHHERKTDSKESRANRQPSLDNIYGSVWLTSGMDSILHISGKQGENYVTYTHLKPIVNMLDPIDAMHDQENGRTEVLKLAKSATAKDAKIEQVFTVIEYASQGGGVITSAEVVGRSGISVASANRYIKQLVESGRIVEASPYIKASGTPATYRAIGAQPASEAASTSRLGFEPETA